MLSDKADLLSSLLACLTAYGAQTEQEALFSILHNAERMSIVFPNVFPVALDILMDPQHSETGQKIEPHSDTVGSIKHKVQPFIEATSVYSVKRIGDNCAEACTMYPCSRGHKPELY